MPKTVRAVTALYRNLTERELREAARARGLTIAPRGSAWRIHGGGVDILVHSLYGTLSLASLEPARFTSTPA